MDPKTTTRSDDGLRLRLVTLALFLLAMFLLGAAIPYACHVTYVTPERLERAEADLRDKMLELGRTADEIEERVLELHRSYKARRNEEVANDGSR